MRSNFYELKLNSMSTVMRNIVSIFKWHLSEKNANILNMTTYGTKQS